MQKLILIAALSIYSCFSANLAAQEMGKVQAYQAKNFEQLIGHVPGLNDELLTMHLKLYKGYVDNVNLLLEKLAALRTKGKSRTPEYAELKRRLGWEFDGMLLHEYYFSLFGKTAMLKDDHPLMQKMKKDFGSYEEWKKDFIATGLMRGIGWVVAYIDPKEERLVNMWINEHDAGHLAGGKPVLIMDVFEHAYMPQFGLDRAKYIEVFFDNINWEEAAKRFEQQLLNP